MRILIHMGDPYTFETPCANRMRVFYDIWTELGHEVYILAPKVNNDVFENVYFCPTVPLKKKTVFYRLMNSLIYGVTSFFMSFRIRSVDIVLTTSPPPLISIWGWLIAKIKSAKLIYDVRDIWPDVAIEMGSIKADSLYFKCFKCIRNFMLKRSDLVTTVSPGKVNKLQKYSSTKVVHIRNGLDELFLKNTVDESIVSKYFRDHQFSCVYIGNLGLAQGLKQLLYVAKQAKINNLPVKFLLFGSGAEENILKDDVKSQHLDNVDFLGRISNQEIYTILKYANISFVSLVNDKLTDSIPTKLYEALGVGCPVLLAAVGDSVDILNECKLGISVEPNNQKELWNGFLYLYSNYEDFIHYKNAAINVILEKHSRQKAAYLLEKEFYKL